MPETDAAEPQADAADRLMPETTQQQEEQALPQHTGQTMRSNTEQPKRINPAIIIGIWIARTHLLRSVAPF